jgi:hypothetical protein
MTRWLRHDLADFSERSAGCDAGADAQCPADAEAHGKGHSDAWWPADAGAQWAFDFGAGTPCDADDDAWSVPIRNAPRQCQGRDAALLAKRHPDVPSPQR